MKSINILLCFFLFSTISFGQGKFLTKQGYASFFSSSPAEDIEANNNQVLSIIDTSTGTIAISILMKSFMFEKSLMQEHFNENYVESDKYPKAIFKGQILDFKNIAGNEQVVSIVGDITIHGVTKKLETQGKINKTEGSITLAGDFPVKVADFGIKIPSVVVNNIAETIKVTFELDHKPYKK
ncbi:YceI family protein [uncultured Aquimarina sp.]|uniref:YceI family protein n=1 Tax=uncultured Aquimarina sp. TaxID=575652 RepID=UPI00262399D9|nr:YceI family protein [uncultured Aquimarina sp.]